MDLWNYAKQSTLFFFPNKEKSKKYVLEKASLSDGLIWYAISMLISLLLTPLGLFFGLDIFLRALLGVILVGVGALAGILIYFSLIHLFYLLMGGKGTFKDTIRIMLSISFGFLVYTSLAVIFSVITLGFGAIIGYPVLILSSYWFYFVSIVTLGEKHKLSNLKAFLGFNLPLIIFFAIMIFIFFIMTILGVGAQTYY